MRFAIADILRLVGNKLPDGEVVMKFKPLPKQKPPRRQPGVKNKSNRSDYMKDYMKDYRDEGKDYQKVPEAVKEWRREQKDKAEENKEKI